MSIRTVSLREQRNVRCHGDNQPQQHHSEAQIPPPNSLLPDSKNAVDYLDLSSTPHPEDDEESISDWSEEDLSLHFSPSVILQSDESDPESGFECVTLKVEPQVRRQDGEGLKMVPKREIQLKKNNDSENDGRDAAAQVKDRCTEGGGDSNQLQSSTISHRPELLLRQHSMPASFCPGSMTSSGADSSTVYRGQPAGDSTVSGLLPGGPPRCLQKSFSLDETKTKMASYLIKNVLSKKMQVEQDHMPRKVSPEGDSRHGGNKGPVPVVRDVRSFLRHSCRTGDRTSPILTKDGTSVSQPQNKIRRPFIEQRQSSEPIRNKESDELLAPPISQSESDITSDPYRTHSHTCVPKQSSVPRQSPQVDTQKPFQPCFYTASHLQPHLGRVSFLHAPPAPTFHLLRGSQQNPSDTDQTKTTRDQDQDQTGTQNRTRSKEDDNGPSSTGDEQNHHPQVLSWVPVFLPAQVRGNFLVDVSGGVFLRVHAPCHMMVDPKRGQCVYVDVSPQPQSKMLLDPETGQSVQVFLPAAGPTPNTTVFPGHSPNPTSTVLRVGRAVPPLFSVIPSHPLTVSSLYSAPYLTYPLMTSHSAVMPSQPQSSDVTPM
ncbi:uncharacterized protein KZ484_017844 [Pholidichthys leucotaenia]